MMDWLGVLHNPDQHDREPTVRIWPILALAFSALVALIALSGWLSFVRAASTYSDISRLYQSEHQAQESLSAIRFDIAESAILLRDFLLDPGLSATVARAEMQRQRNAATAELNRLGSLIPPEQIRPLGSLRRQTDAYWNSLAPLFAIDGKQPSRPGFALIRAQILPRREAAYTLVAEFSQLSFDAFGQRRNEIDAKHAALARFLGNLAVLTILIAVFVAAFSVYRMHALERIANLQHRQVLAAETQLRKLSRQLVRTQEEERRALSRDLHDQIGQVLTALRMSLGNAILFAQNTDVRVKQELELAKRLVLQALRSTRDLAMGLRPTMLDDLGLAAALEWYARQHGKISGVPVTLALEASPDQLADAQRTCIYRIVQEALNNSAKYANATQIHVKITASPGFIELEIGDDGLGFDMADGYRPGLGLLGMRERVTQLGGELIIESKPAHGTRIHTRLPLATVDT